MVYYDSRFRCVVDEVPCSVGCPGAQQRGQTDRASKERRGRGRSRKTASKICDMAIEGWSPKEWRQSAVRFGFEVRRMELELVWSTFKSTLWIG
jgi:hypothetical protein